MLARAWTVLLCIHLSFAIHILLHPPLPSTIKLPTHVSAAEARVILGFRMGYEQLGPNRDVDKKLGGLLTVDSQTMQGLSNALLITMDEETAKDVIPASLAVSLALPSPPFAAKLLPTVMASIINTLKGVYPTVITASSVAFPRSVARLARLYSIAPSRARETFLEEAARLDTLASSHVADRTGAAFDMKGLAAMAKQYGRKSEQYQLAVETARELLVAAMANRHLSLVVLTYPASKWF